MDIGCLKMEENEHIKNEDILVARNPVDSWISTVQALEKSSAVSPNQIVYSNDEHGNPVPIGIIINENFSGDPKNLENSLPYESDQLMNAEWHWVAGQEECVSNSTEEKENGEIVKCEAEHHEMQNDKSNAADEPVIKVYKSALSKKRTSEKKQRIKDDSE